jgi:hypothetical protein
VVSGEEVDTGSLFSSDFAGQPVGLKSASGVGIEGVNVENSSAILVDFDFFKFGEHFWDGLIQIFVVSGKCERNIFLNATGFGIELIGGNDSTLNNIGGSDSTFGISVLAGLGEISESNDFSRSESLFDSGIVFKVGWSGVFNNSEIVIIE